MQLRDSVERQERRIAELERNIESERYRREVAESVLEDPHLMHQLNVEIERLQSALSDRERELEQIDARAEAGGETAVAVSAPEFNGVPPEQLSELEGKIAVYEIELLELRARLEDVVDREFADLREGELQQEIERLSVALASTGETQATDEQLAPLREALSAAQDARDQATERATALAARVDALEAAAASSEGAPDAEELLAPLRAELAAAQAEGEKAAARADALESERAERESELKGEIERLSTELTAAAGAPDAEELLAPLRAELAAAQAEAQ